MKEKHDIKNLFDRFRKGETPSDERKLMFRWFSQLDVQNRSLDQEDVRQQAARSKDELKRRLLSRQDGLLRKNRLRWLQRAAAAVLMVGMTAMYWYLQDRPEMGAPVITTVTTAPTDQPQIRLGDGTSVLLDTLSATKLSVDKYFFIEMQGDVIRYSYAHTTGVEDQALEQIRHELITPKGKQYQVILPDDTRIWLNAASKLTYPVRFAADSRSVALSGEAYFEVSRSKDWPFVVQTSLQQVAVLGTEFNITAYPDDDEVKTTLVEGAVRIAPFGSAGTAHAAGTVLKPGQQAISHSRSDKLRVIQADPYEVVSWKDHLFVFADEEISEAMKKVSRWYDVEVHYQDDMADKLIGGAVPRLRDIDELMDALASTGVFHYKLKGGKVIISK